jgi:hypothetical protein
MADSWALIPKKQKVLISYLDHANPVTPTARLGSRNDAPAMAFASVKPDNMATLLAPDRHAMCNCVQYSPIRFADHVRLEPAKHLLINDQGNGQSRNNARIPFWCGGLPRGGRVTRFGCFATSIPPASQLIASSFLEARPSNTEGQHRQKDRPTIVTAAGCALNHYLLSTPKSHTTGFPPCGPLRSSLIRHETKDARSRLEKKRGMTGQRAWRHPPGRDSRCHRCPHRKIAGLPRDRRFQDDL